MYIVQGPVQVTRKVTKGLASRSPNGLRPSSRSQYRVGPVSGSPHGLGPASRSQYELGRRIFNIVIGF